MARGTGPGGPWPVAPEPPLLLPKHSLFLQLNKFQLAQHPPPGGLPGPYPHTLGAPVSPRGASTCDGEALTAMGGPKTLSFRPHTHLAQNF